MSGYSTMREALSAKLGLVFDTPEPAPTITAESAPDQLGDSLRAKLGIEAETAEAERLDIGQGVRGTAPAAPVSPQEQLLEALERAQDVSARRWGHAFGNGREPGWRDLG